MDGWPTRTQFSILRMSEACHTALQGGNTLDSDIKQFALLCEQNVEALWRPNGLVDVS